MELHISHNGSLTGIPYCDEIILPDVHLFRGVFGPDFTFVADSSRPYRNSAVEELQESENIYKREWPACSPDLSLL
ncbi:transposable element Tcb2 transposase [Trichonephila clavipes]|nr:transposable element Tcb2 transposase [Trichonephila clavipes]